MEKQAWWVPSKHPDHYVDRTAWALLGRSQYRSVANLTDIDGCFTEAVSVETENRSVSFVELSRLRNCSSPDTAI